ncbi:MAG: alanine/glycine:cation symporter family protein [Flavobacteriales bacterium]|jgi:AGCS family alanine or glycine:cation symporter|tara:strand:+ start:1027 stop:2577 length:1551 start_codon:yes stop_codon:yes gene_type:complete
MKINLHKLFTLLLSIGLTIPLLAQDKTFDDRINDIMEPVTGFLGNLIFYPVTLGGYSIPFVLIWLVVGAIIFTVYMGFINIRGFKHAIDVVRGKFDDPNDPGEVSHFQALTAALSGTVGVGNIAGVAVAVSLGGPGATFWMIVAGLIGMSSKFVECTLGLKYRKINPDGSVSGGPMHYLSKGLAAQGKSGMGKVLAILFAIACIGGSFGGGNMVQINQATQQFQSLLPADSFLAMNGWVFGVVMSVVVGVIIIGGIKSIAKITDKVVPFMVGIYVLAALIVIGANISNIGWAFGQIIGGAFDPDALYGGIIGVMIQGFKRAAFSNEAGIGSASIAHSAAKTDEPVSEGIVALLEPFIDTVVICTMTALVIIFANYGDYTAQSAFEATSTGGNDAGIKLTSSAFAQTISWFPYVLAVAVILFALSTMISWSYYGLKAWTYLFGESNSSQNVYRILFCLFVIVGSAISAKQVFDFGDTMIFAMCFPNVLGLYFLMPEVRKDLRNYLQRVKSGEIKRFN